MLKSLISLTGKSWQPAVGQQVAKSLQKNGNSTEVTHGGKRSWDVSRKENPDCSFWRWVWQTTHALRSSPADELQGLPSGNSTGWVNLTGVLNMPTLGYNFQKQTPFSLILLLPWDPNSPLLLQVSWVPHTQHIQSERVISSSPIMVPPLSLNAHNRTLTVEKIWLWVQTLPLTALLTSKA